MTRDEERRLLTEGEVDVEGVIAGSSNQALLVRVRAGGLEALACYKAEVAERPLWDFPGGLWRREVAAYELDRALGTDLVPTTVGRADLPLGAGSLQWWVEDNGEDHYFTLRARPELEAWLMRLAAFDVVANNADRKSGHVLFDGERPWAIDNGLCFHEDDKLRTVVWEFAGRPVPEALLERLGRVGAGAVGDLARWIDPGELALTELRAEALAASGTYPVPDESGDWPPYPWPLV